MASIFTPLHFLQSFINRLLPFTTPGTPLLQDIAHTLFLCTVLYFGPSIQQYVQHRFVAQDDPTSTQHPLNDLPPNQHAEIPDRNDFQAVPGQPPINDHNAEAEEPNSSDDDLDDDLLDAPPQPPYPADHPLPPNAAAPNANPANGGAPHPNNNTTATNRNVGAKKARSLARREQRRAYHEFQRSRGEAQRAAERADAEERETAVYEEKRRRAVAEMAIEERRRGEVVTMITGMGYVVRVKEEDMREVYRRALEEVGGEEGRGKIGYDELGGILEQVIKTNATTVVQ
ncbi:hypothetical protein EV356DRAFT_271616 [Viridothelium virens]|uniref:Uncharacterized protein n=1 Tax=Viridothelium virens TaxID=1048519 RepID=A0A6A6H281_VIRVR|nr:hypothetical protein EV356DRAFT_271616 [Viridothelium virens]